MMDLLDVTERAWKAFCQYYRDTCPVKSEGDGDTKTINSEQAATASLGMFLHRELLEEGSKFAALEEFPYPKSRDRMDIAIVDPEHWLDVKFRDEGRRHQELAGEFKFLLGGNNSSYNLDAIKKDCKKLKSLDADYVRDRVMFVIVRSSDWTTDIKETLERDYPDIHFMIEPVLPNE